MRDSDVKYDLHTLKICLKHDIAAIKRPIGLMLLLMAGAGLMMGLCLLGILTIIETMISASSGAIALMVLLYIAFFVSIFALIVGMAAATLLAYRHIYMSFFTDQGYLTFTLPVKRSVHYLSKLIILTVAETASILLFFLSILWVALAAGAAVSGNLFHSAVTAAIGNFFEWLWQVGGGWVFLWIPVALIALVALVVSSTGLISLCITIACAKSGKHKVWLGIGLYYAINFISGIATPLPSLILLFPAIEAWGAAAAVGGAALGITVTVILLAVAAIAACVSAIYHYIAIGHLERKLNLA